MHAEAIALCTRLGHPPSSHDQYARCLCGRTRYIVVKPKVRPKPKRDQA